MPDMPSEEFIQETITGLPEGSVPKTNEFVNPANSTVPDAIQESGVIIEETEGLDKDVDVGVAPGPPHRFFF